jgi:hypothetical protein
MELVTNGRVLMNTRVAVAEEWADAVSDTRFEEVPVELDDQGLSSGVEREETASDGIIDEPFDPAKIDVQTRTVTVDLLMSRLKRGVLDLSPDFQRLTGIWKPVPQSRLIESLLLRIPLPVFYAAESGEESWAVVDGIQRLSTIARFVVPEAIDERPLKLRGLEYLKQFEGLTYDQLPGAMQTRINETELIVNLIRAGTPEPVMFNIFARINTGGKPLTRQELRHALIPGPARDLLRALADSDPFKAATQSSVNPSRMADREMVLRFFAFRMTDPSDYGKDDLDGLLGDTMRQINNMSSDELDALTADFIRAMDAAADIFGEYAFRKVYEGRNRQPVNKALFEAESVNLAMLSEQELHSLLEHKDKLRDNLLDCFDESGFVESISYATGSVGNVRTRFNRIARLLDEVII